MSDAVWSRRWVNATLVGLGVGLVLFLLEGAMVLRSGAIGVSIDTEGPFAAVFNAIRPKLPWLLARIVVFYLGAGACLGALAGVLAEPWPWKTGWKRHLVLLLELAGLWALIVARHAITRPALFDDVPQLGWLVRWGVQAEPWHISVIAAAWLFGHLVQMLRQSRMAQKGITIITALSLLGARPASGPPKHDPLLVLIGIDAFRPDRLGKGVAPNLDGFVRDATVFTHAYTPIAQTEPAWRSLVTARWPFIAGSRYPLTATTHWPSLPTAPKQLTEAGFETVFETDCSRFNYQPESSGFHTRRQPPQGALNFALEKFRFRVVGILGDNSIGAALLPELIENRALAGIHDPVSYAHRLGQRLVSTAQSGPTLFAFHATAAHFPGDPVYPYYRKFVSPEAPLERRLRMVFSPIADGVAKNPPGWGLAESEALYDELLAQADSQLGQLLDALKSHSHYDAATIVVFSDHGESFHSDLPPLHGATPVHGARLDDEENRILLAVKPAYGRKVETVDQLVRLIDVMPTLLDAAGQPPLPQADGRSLLPLLRGESLPDAFLYAETGFTHASPAAFDKGHLTAAPRTFDAYVVHPDGLVEMSESAHTAVLKEKDVGAFDGTHWLVRSPRVDGTTAQRCDGDCDALEAFLNHTLEEKP